MSIKAETPKPNCFIFSSSKVCNYAMFTITSYKKKGLSIKKGIVRH